MEAPWQKMRILVDRSIYQGLRRAPKPTPSAISRFAAPLQDQDEKGSLVWPKSGRPDLPMSVRAGQRLGIPM
jgi:hypothetical protein